MTAVMLLSSGDVIAFFIMNRVPRLYRAFLDALRRPGAGRRLVAAMLAVWVFGAFQLLALPAAALGTCSMVCSLDGSGCCCRLDFGTMDSPTGEHRFFGRTHAEQLDRTCPAAAVTAVSHLAGQADDGVDGQLLPPETIVRIVSLVERGTTPGDTRRLDPPRPPPSILVPSSSAPSLA